MNTQCIDTIFQSQSQEWVHTCYNKRLNVQYKRDKNYRSGGALTALYRFNRQLQTSEYEK